MHFSSESSGDEGNERKYWKYFKSFKQENTTPLKMWPSIKEEDELSGTDINATPINDFSLNLESNGFNSSDHSKSFEIRRSMIEKNNKNTVDKLIPNFDWDQLENEGQTYKDYIEQNPIVQKQQIEIVNNKINLNDKPLISESKPIFWIKFILYFSDFPLNNNIDAEGQIFSKSEEITDSVFDANNNFPIKVGSKSNNSQINHKHSESEVRFK